MHALLVNGPMAKRQITVEDPPPMIVRMDELHPDVLVSQLGPLGTEPAGTASATHSYALFGVEPIPSPLAPRGLNPLAVYLHAPESG